MDAYSSCDENEFGASLSEPNSLQSQYISEQLASPISAEELLLSPVEDIVETSSQVARSILSNVFRTIGKEAKVEDDADSEVEILEEYKPMQSQSPCSVPAFQSPRTVARVSNWINDLQSDFSTDEGLSLMQSPKRRQQSKSHSSSSRVESVGTNDDGEVKDITAAEDDVQPATDEDDDDQPSGYTRIMTPMIQARSDKAHSESGDPGLKTFRLRSVKGSTELLGENDDSFHNNLKGQQHSNIFDPQELSSPMRNKSGSSSWRSKDLELSDQFLASTASATLSDLQGSYGKTWRTFSCVNF